MNTLIIRIVLVALAAFAAVRAALYGLYPDYFAQTVNLGAAFVKGMRFDGKLIVLLLIPFLLPLLLPFGKLNSRRLRRWLAWACAAVLTVALGVAVADLAYFGEVQRHIGGEILNLGGDAGFIWQTAFGSRIGYTLAGVAALAVFLGFWYTVVVRPIASETVSGSLKTRVFWNVAQLVLLVLLARGMVLKGKPLSAVDAFDGTGAAQANLTLNGVLVTLDAVRDRNDNRPLVYLTEPQSQTFARQYPQPFRYQSTQPASGRNIVFILLESWSYRYIDALSGNHYSVTPHMDKLVGQSAVWHNFHAAGQRSIIGIQAALTSVPALPEREPLGFGLELSNMSRIAELAGQHGYRTLMVQSSKRRSFHMDGIAKALGFQEYYGQEDVPLIRQYPQPTPPFGWDYDTLMFMGRQIDRQPEKPFFAFLFTGTTHEPFADAGTEFARYPHDEKGENGFLNALAYSDWAVGQFMDYAARQPWYRNTLFVFSADHTLNSGKTAAPAQERFHIPLLIFDPQQPTASQHHQLAGQYDLLPTFADLLGIQTPVYTFGQSLYAAPRRTVPLMLNQGATTIMLADDGGFAEMHNGQIVGGNTQHPDLAYWQWRMQTADAGLRQNTWAP